MSFNDYFQTKEHQQMAEHFLRMLFALQLDRAICHRNPTNGEVYSFTTHRKFYARMSVIFVFTNETILDIGKTFMAKSQSSASIMIEDLES